MSSESPSTDDCCPHINSGKTLAELTGMDWGPPPADARIAIVERHETRRKRLVDWTSRELIRFLCIGGDEQVLVPFAIERLNADPLAAGGSRAGELLSATLESDGFDWARHPTCVHRIREIVAHALGQIAVREEDALREGWHLYRSWAIFERRLSSVP